MDQTAKSFRQLDLVQILYLLVGKYPTPTNLSYMWNFGVFALLALIIQIITGILLVMHYTPHTDLAFISCEHIMRDVNLGWLLRYCHSKVQASFLLWFIYMFFEV